MQQYQGRLLRVHTGENGFGASELTVRPTDLTAQKWGGPFATIGVDPWSYNYQLLLDDAGKPLAILSRAADGRLYSADDVKWPSEAQIEDYADPQVVMEDGSNVRTDGFYQWFGDELYGYLKFFEDGTVAQIRPWTMSDPSDHISIINEKIVQPAPHLRDYQEELSPVYEGKPFARFGEYSVKDGSVLVKIAASSGEISLRCSFDGKELLVENNGVSRKPPQRYYFIPN